MMKDIARRLSQKPFAPHPALANPHAQTIAGSLLPRRTPLLDRSTKERVFDVAPNVRVMAHCSWQEEIHSRPTLILVHGLEGSSASPYMLGTAEKALRAGFNALRLNVRNCGGTAHLTDTLYHAGLTDDLRAVIDELAERDGLDEIYLVGFSLGGNVALKLAGEYAASAPRALRGVIAVSPSIHLSRCARAMEMRSNALYQLRFLRALRRSLRAKARLFPDRYDASLLKGVKSIRQFDETFVAPHWGFRDAEDYYARASSFPLMGRIQIPTLILHAKDDPFIPFDQFEQMEENPAVLLMAAERGGHVGFISRKGEDRFWYETMTAQFVRLLQTQIRA
jgi:hypothetical protein